MRKVLESALVGRIKNCAVCSLVGLIRNPLETDLAGLVREPLGSIWPPFLRAQVIKLATKWLPNQCPKSPQIVNFHPALVLPSALQRNCLYHHGECYEHIHNKL